LAIRSVIDHHQGDGGMLAASFGAALAN